jgi:TRAP-type C4-dicarboxylate transport system permease small subunit
MRIVYKATRWLAIALFTLLVSTVFASVVIRYFGILAGSIDWVEEAARFLFIWVCFLGAALAFESGSHVCIDILLQFLSVRQQRLLGVALEALVAIFAVLMIRYGYELTARTVDQPALVLQFSMAWVHLAVPVSGTIILAGAIQRMAQHLAGMRSAYRSSLQGPQPG